MITWQTSLAILIFLGLWRGRMVALQEMGIEVMPILFPWQNRALPIVIPGIAGLISSSLITEGAPFSHLWLLLPWIACWIISYYFTNWNKDRYVLATSEIAELHSTPAQSLFDDEFNSDHTKTPR